jgi:death-on-curing protein
MASKAAALLYALAKSQACTDGNKRLALICVIGFLRLNGMELAVSNTEIADEIERIGASDPEDREALVQELTEWVRAALRRRL